jgi:hypothetical protein
MDRTFNNGGEVGFANEKFQRRNGEGWKILLLMAFGIDCLSRFLIGAEVSARKRCRTGGSAIEKEKWIGGEKKQK